MSMLDDTPIQVEAEEEPKKTRPEQHIVKSVSNFHILKKHKDDKTLDEIYSAFHKWKPSHEVWIYKYGSITLGVASTLSASYINYHFRETLFLLNYTRLSSYALMFLAPGLSAIALHYLLITRRLLQEKRTATDCSVCYQIQGMAFQGLSAIGYPMILVPLICYPVAKRLKNYSVPAFTLKNGWPVIQFTREMLRPIRGPLWAITAAQAVLGMGITFYEQYNYALVIKPKLDKVPTFFTPLDPREMARRRVRPLETDQE